MRLILVGGFLGAGKTSLIYEVTKRLMNEGKKVGLITNDQASELVDTAVLLQTQAKVNEVSGSCFCCNYNGFTESIKQIREESQPQYIFAEPVGSCTDLSATIVQPLKDQWNIEMDISPLTVLADPMRLGEILNGGTAGLHPSAAYIFKKQLEESDIILITKSDLLNDSEQEFLKEKVKVHYPHTQVLMASSKTGNGVEEWLDVVIKSSKTGQRIIEVDYDTYAEGEAVLGWLNSSFSLKGKQINWDSFVSQFLNELSSRLDTLKIGVGHIKMILECETKYIIGNITGKRETINIRGEAGISDGAKIILNARVGMSPDDLDHLVKDILEILTKDEISFHIDVWNCLSPGYPNPTYRYNRII